MEYKCIYKKVPIFSSDFAFNLQLIMVEIILYNTGLIYNKAKRK